MNHIVQYFIRGIKNLINFLLAHLLVVIDDLWDASKGIPAKHIARDFISVILSVGMLLFMHSLALFIFLFLPQGKDVLLIVAEEVGVAHNFGNLIWLLIGVFLWSTVSEYACRYAIYVTDHSGKNLTQERVKWRKVLQQVVSEFFLLLPYAIVLIGLVANYFNDTSLHGINKTIGFGIPAICIYFLLNTVARFYFSTERDTWRKDPTWFQRIMLLPEAEKRSCERLYGIYNDYIYTIRKPSNFAGQAKIASSYFASKLLNEKRDYLPQNPEMISPKALVPKEFQFIKFTDEPTTERGYFRWIYRIPNSYYKTLHTQLLIIVSVCSLVFLVICFLPVSAYDNIGSPGLLIVSFTCWSGLYLGVVYLDYGVFRQGKKNTIANRITKNISIRALIPILLVFTSFVNSDHEVRYSQNQSSDNRPLLRHHFVNWFEDYKSDSVNNLYINKVDSNKFYPVTFICAEGGALRTGAFAALTLSFLQDSLHQNNDFNFKESIYAFSGVSGGSLGVSFFNSIAYLDNNKSNHKTFTDKTHEFFRNDFLAPVIGKMFYGDILNLFIPWHIKGFDRAIALEKSWEGAYNNIISKNEKNFFSSDYLKIYGNSHKYPALFINTTEVETGRQCWVTNVKPHSNMILGEERDLIHHRFPAGIRYSTMINFSTRFPLFSPGAAVVESDSRKYHYVDGGYYENTGMKTMKEVLNALAPVIKMYEKEGIYIQPNVLVIRFSEDNDIHKNVTFANELSEVLLGIYNTRAGRAEVAKEQLKRLVEEDLNGNVATLHLGMSNSEVPMNWVLSTTSLNNIHKDINEKWESRYNNDLSKLFFVNGELVRPYR